jgi:meiotic recombination protein SPO11
MQWLGVQMMRDVLATVEDDEAVLRMTGRDRRKAARMLEGLMIGAGTGGEDRTDEQCKAELQVMLMLNLKAEMQILDERPGGLPAWLDRRIESHIAYAW